MYRWNGRVYMLEPVRREIIVRGHDVSLVGHFGVTRTLDLISRTYYWPKMKDDIQDYIRHCQMCQVNKSRTHAPYGLLDPLGIPEGPWVRVGIDLIVELPPLTKYKWDSICVVIDYYTKMAHFVSCKISLTVEGAADIMV